ncbi:MAG: hypothetical protein FK734_12675 [Asgard group archaeon]|nr:hypothetical protein [Asgard group archaeon]
MRVNYYQRTMRATVMMDRINYGIFSAKTNIPFRAGKMAAERSANQLFDENPVLCLVFFSEIYSSPELVEGIVQAINPDIVAGCSTNGEIAAGYWRETVSAITISSDFMRFGIAAEANDSLLTGSEESYKNFYERALDDLRKKMIFQESKMTIPVNPKDIVPDFAILFLPGTDFELDPKANEVITNLRKFMGDIPIFGGTIGDDCNYETGYVIYKDELLENHTLLILCRSDLQFAINQKHGYHKKEELVLTESERNRLISLNTRPAAEVYFEKLNIPIVEITDLRDEICALNPLAIEDPITKELQVLFPLSRGKDASELNISQTLTPSTKIFITEADIEESKKAALESIKGAYSESPIKDPRLAIMLTCVGRSTFYLNRAQEEIEEIQKRFKYTGLGGAYLNGTIAGRGSYVSEGTAATLLIGNDLVKRAK